MEAERWHHYQTHLNSPSMMLRRRRSLMKCIMMLVVSLPEGCCGWLLHAGTGSHHMLELWLLSREVEADESPNLAGTGRPGPAWWVWSQSIICWPGKPPGRGAFCVTFQLNHFCVLLMYTESRLPLIERINLADISTCLKIQVYFIYLQYTHLLL